jgi:CheY-like chemotaxis protein
MRVLLVEDEPLLLMAASDMLVDLGHHVAGMATSLRSALQAANSLVFDIAVLDVNLGGERVDEVAAVLGARQIPFVFTTGYDAKALPPAFAERPYVAKPIDAEQLALALRAACTHVETAD